MTRRPTKPFTLATRLNQHPFAQLVFEDNRLVLRQAFTAGRAGDIEAKPARALTELEWYVRACGFSLSHYLGLLYQLAQIPGYIAQYHRSSSLASREVTRATDVSYHLENFLIRTQSLQDRTLQLSSAAMHTGLDLRSVSYASIIRNGRVRSVGLDVALKKVNALCQRYAQTRNQVVHQHGLLDSDLRRVEILLMGSRAFEGDRRAAMSNAYRRLIGSIAQREVTEFDEFTRSAVELSEELFGVLHRQYELIKTRLTCA